MSGETATAYLAQRPADPSAWEAIALWMNNVPTGSFTRDDYYVWNTNIVNDRWLQLVVATIVDVPYQPAQVVTDESGWQTVEIAPAQPGRSAASFAEPYMWGFAYPEKSIYTQTLQNLSNAAGYGYSINWDRYARLAAEQHFRQFGQHFRIEYTNPVAWLNMLVDQAQADYPNLANFRAPIDPGSEFYNQGQKLSVDAAYAIKRSDKANFLKFLTVVLAPVAAALFAPAAAVSAGASTGVLQGAELAALVEAGTVGVEGAFLEAAALSGSQVIYSASTGALLEAVTPAGDLIVFDAAVDPFTQFGVETFQPVTPNEPLAQPAPTSEPLAQSTPSSAPSTPTSSVTKAATDYAKKLALSELNKLVSGSPQSPGARAALTQGSAGVAPGEETADITPLVALALVAGAYIYSKRK